MDEQTAQKIGGLFKADLEREIMMGLQTIYKLSPKIVTRICDYAKTEFVLSKTLEEVKKKQEEVKKDRV